MSSLPNVDEHKNHAAHQDDEYQLAEQFVQLTVQNPHRGYADFASDISKARPRGVAPEEFTGLDVVELVALVPEVSSQTDYKDHEKRQLNVQFHRFSP